MLEDPGWPDGSKFAWVYGVPPARVTGDIAGATKIRANGKNQSLGKHLFLRSDWMGKLDLYSPLRTWPGSTPT